jgi:phosphoglycolate phosphatase-like HAD superfamily hydrolase
VTDFLVLWDIDGTLLDAGGVGRDLYDVVFVQLFGRPLSAYAPMAGRTDRAIILETLVLAGVNEPRRYVDPFIASLGAHAPSVRSAVAARGQALPGAAAVLAALASMASRAPAWSLGALAAFGVPAAARAMAGAGVTAGTAVTAGAGTAPAETARNEAGLAGFPGFSWLSGSVHQSVLTGNIRPVAEVKLTALGLRDGLDLCIGAYGDDHEDRAELVQVARRRAAAVHGRSVSDFAGAATVVIGDTPLDVSAALSAGARAVGVATGSYPAADLIAAGAHAVLPDLTDTSAVLRALMA